MIISASRRTDIPSFYSEWFFNRVKEGSVLVRNPMNFHQVSRIDISPGAVDAIVFWTKNPLPMLERLGELKDYMYYFQFTLTPYGRDVEPGLPSKKGVILPAFKRLAGTVGADRIIWRYDPILINERYSEEYHLRAFGEIAEGLRGYTRKVIISFIDCDYRGVKDNIRDLALRSFPGDAQARLASGLAEISRSFGLEIAACAESADLGRFGIGQAHCIDERLIGRLSGRQLNIKKDRSQRPGCCCAESADIGMYNTCRNGCLYCYANYIKTAAVSNHGRHDPLSSFISP